MKVYSSGSRIDGLMVDWDNPVHIQAAKQVMVYHWPAETLDQVYARVQGSMASADNWEALSHHPRREFFRFLLHVVACAQALRREVDPEYTPVARISDFI